jgi:hypothetical protein
MNRIKAVVTMASTAAILATAFSGVASAHISPPTALPANTNLMVCANHGTTDIVIAGPVFRTVKGANGCYTFQNLPAGDYTIGSQEEKEEEPAPCRAAADADPAHAAYPLCFGYGFFTHHIEVDRPGSTQYPGAKFEPPVAEVHVGDIPDGTAPTPPAPPALGPRFCDTATVSSSALSAVGYTVDTSVVPNVCSRTTADGLDPLGILPGKDLNITVVELHLHQAYGHI